MLTAPFSYLSQFPNHVTLSSHKDVPALASDDITGIVKGATWIAVASLTTIVVIWKTPVFWQALVAITSSHITLTCALSRVNVATLVVDCAQCVARASWKCPQIKTPFLEAVNISVWCLDLIVYTILVLLQYLFGYFKNLFNKTVKLST